MIKLKPRLIIPLLLVFLCLTAAKARAEVSGGEFFMSDAPVEITADNISYDKSTDTYHATGNVVITQGPATLKAEEVVMSATSGVATAKGAVRMADEAGNTLAGEDLQMNMKEQTAVISNARIFYVEENLHITASVIKKTGPKSYYSEKTTYTTCDCEEDKNPAWSFRVSSASVTFGQFLTGWNARFYIKGVPAFYFPYVSVPVQRKRQSGFLQPNIGYSELRGTAVENSFFWAISDNTDATFYLDVETSRGAGEGIEYRYIRTRRSYGELYLYHFGEKNMERVRSFRDGVDNLSRPANASDTRLQLKFNHTEVFGNGIRLRANINFVSDDEFLLDFAGRGERSLESIENNISLSKSWGSYNLVAQLRYFNNILDDEDKTTLQRMPEITFASFDRKLSGTPFYLSSESSFINFSRKEGVTGQRLDVKPRISLPMSPGGLIDITPSIAPRATLYLLEDNPGGSYAERYIYDITVDAATTFVRVFRPGLKGVEAMRHTVRPRLTYTYIPGADQQDLPQFDAVDDVAGVNSISYSLVSALTGKTVEGEAARYRDYAYFDLRQSYDIKEATRRLAAPGDRRRPFSDIRAELMLSPSEKLRFTALGEYDVYESWFNSYNASLAAKDGRGDSVNLAYRFVREESTRYLEASARLRVARPLDLTYLKRFSFDEDRSIETAYGVEYRHQCWSSTLTYSERLEERVVFLTFDLSGLGRVAGIEGTLQPL